MIRSIIGKIAGALKFSNIPSTTKRPITVTEDIQGPTESIRSIFTPPWAFPVPSVRPDLWSLQARSEFISTNNPAGYVIIGYDEAGTEILRAPVSNNDANYVSFDKMLEGPDGWLYGVRATSGPFEAHFVRILIEGSQITQRELMLTVPTGPLGGALGFYYPQFAFLDRDGSFAVPVSDNSEINALEASTGRSLWNITNANIYPALVTSATRLRFDGGQWVLHKITNWPSHTFISTDALAGEARFTCPPGQALSGCTEFLFDASCEPADQIIAGCAGASTGYCMFRELIPIVLPDGRWLGLETMWQPNYDLWRSMPGLSDFAEAWNPGLVYYATASEERGGNGGRLYAYDQFVSPTLAAVDCQGPPPFHRWAGTSIADYDFICTNRFYVYCGGLTNQVWGNAQWIYQNGAWQSSMNTQVSYLGDNYCEGAFGNGLFPLGAYGFGTTSSVPASARLRNTHGASPALPTITIGELVAEYNSTQWGSNYRLVDVASANQVFEGAFQWDCEGCLHSPNSPIDPLLYVAIFSVDFDTGYFVRATDYCTNWDHDNNPNTAGILACNCNQNITAAQRSDQCTACGDCISGGLALRNEYEEDDLQIGGRYDFLYHGQIIDATSDIDYVYLAMTGHERYNPDPGPIGDPNPSLACANYYVPMGLYRGRIQQDGTVGPWENFMPDPFISCPYLIQGGPANCSSTIYTFDPLWTLSSPHIQLAATRDAVWFLERQSATCFADPGTSIQIRRLLRFAKNDIFASPTTIVEGEQIRWISSAWEARWK